MTRKENKVGQSRITYAGAAQSLQGAKVEKTRGNRGKGLKRKRQNTVRPEEENESHAEKDERKGNQKIKQEGKKRRVQLLKSPK